MNVIPKRACVKGNFPQGTTPFRVCEQLNQFKAVRQTSWVLKRKDPWKEENSGSVVKIQERKVFKVCVVDLM